MTDFALALNGLIGLAGLANLLLWLGVLAGGAQRVKEQGRCPWCREEVAPVANDDLEGSTRWLLANPLKCPRCGAVGDHHDFELLETR